MSRSTPSPFLLEIGRRGRKIRLQIGTVVIGRHPRKCQVIFEQPAISRTHCLLVVRRESVSIRDLQSSNGTYVNGQRIGESELIDGDCVRIGKAVLKLIRTGIPDPNEGFPRCPVAADSPDGEDATEYQMATRRATAPVGSPSDPVREPALPTEAAEVIPDALLDMLFEVE